MAGLMRSPCLICVSTTVVHVISGTESAVVKLFFHHGSHMSLGMASFTKHRGWVNMDLKKCFHNFKYEKLISNTAYRPSAWAVISTQEMDMAGEIPVTPSASGKASAAQMQQLENALNQIGVTRSHKSIIFLVVCGVLFDVFEQNAVGLVGPLLRQQWGLDATDIAFLNTITFFAAAMGRLLSGYLADLMGRRFMLNVNLALFTLGAVGCALAPDYAFLAVARAIVGFGLGGEITTAVTMLAEFCSARFRGTAVGLINVGGGGLGNMLAPAFALGVFTLFPGDDSWRWLFGCLVMPAIFIVFYRRFVPETPRFLLSKGRVEEANQVLSMLAAGKLANAQYELREFITPGSAQEQTAAAQTVQRSSFTDIFRGGYARRTIAVGVASWMTFGAQLSVLTLMPTILVAQGYSITKSFSFTIVMQMGSLLGAIAASTTSGPEPFPV